MDAFLIAAVSGAASAAGSAVFSTAAPAIKTLIFTPPKSDPEVIKDWERFNAESSSVGSGGSSVGGVFHMDGDDSDDNVFHVCGVDTCKRDLRHCVKALLTCSTGVTLQGPRSRSQCECLRRNFFRVCSEELGINLAGIEMVFESHAPLYVSILFEVND
jgi:hypothetical protein